MSFQQSSCVFKVLFFSILAAIAPFLTAQAQLPCLADTNYRKLDFWVGEWDVFNKNDLKVGENRISLVLNDCAVLEEWASTNSQGNFLFSGRSHSTYNPQTKQWQQHWVDNSGSSIDYTWGDAVGNTMQFRTQPFKVGRDSMAVKRLTLYNMNPIKVRQLSEISYNNSNVWLTEFDFLYVRRVTPDELAIRRRMMKMDSLFALNKMGDLADFYTPDATITTEKTHIVSRAAIKSYWLGLLGRGVDWKNDLHTITIQSNLAVLTGIYKMVILQEDAHFGVNRRYTLIWQKDNEGVWRIYQEHYSNL